MCTNSSVFVYFFISILINMMFDIPDERICLLKNGRHNHQAIGFLSKLKLSATPEQASTALNSKSQVDSSLSIGNHDESSFYENQQQEAKQETLTIKDHQSDNYTTDTLVNSHEQKFDWSSNFHSAISSCNQEKTVVDSDSTVVYEEKDLLSRPRCSSGTSGSLVVDIHVIPPTNPSTLLSKSNSSLKPCKHSLSRFQLRSLSEGSENICSNDKKNYSESSKLSDEDSFEFVKSESCRRSYVYHDVNKIETISETMTAKKKHCAENRFVIVNKSHEQSSTDNVGNPVNNIESVFIGQMNDKTCKRKQTKVPSLAKFEIFHENETSSDEEESDSKGVLKCGDISYPDKVRNNFSENSSLNLPINSSSCFTVKNSTTDAFKTSISLCGKFAQNSEKKKHKYFSSFRDGINNILPSPNSAKNTPAFHGSMVYPIMDGESGDYVEKKFSETLVVCQSSDVGIKGGCLSESSSTASMPVCRICQMPSMEPNNHLISPCRCLGSIRYVHNSCLLKWFEMSGKRRNAPPQCEICLYQYLRHKKFIISHWSFPSCSRKDKIFHAIFVLCIIMMVATSVTVFISFEEASRNDFMQQSSTNSTSDRNGLICALLFFLSFLIAIYAEVRSKRTIYQLFCKFCCMNNEWYVEEYDRKKDSAKKLTFMA